jgi:DNA-binding MarR family transcriptional regulator
MSEDVVRRLGYLALGTRMKRIGDRMQADTQRILDSHGFSVQTGQFAFLAVLERLGPLTVGELARTVGVTQPGATRTVGQLVEEGWLTITPSRHDQRQKTVSLTAMGKRQVLAGQRTVFPLVERAVRELCQKLEGSLLEQLGALEDGLAHEPLYRRVERHR